MGIGDDLHRDGSMEMKFLEDNGKEPWFLVLLKWYEGTLITAWAGS